jgi:hypothetical protein
MSLSPHLLAARDPGDAVLEVSRGVAASGSGSGGDGAGVGLGGDGLGVRASPPAAAATPRAVRLNTRSHEASAGPAEPLLPPPPPHAPAACVRAREMDLASALTVDARAWTAGFSWLAGVFSVCLGAQCGQLARPAQGGRLRACVCVCVFFPRPRYPRI